MQAMAVFLLAMSPGVPLFTNRGSNIPNRIKKLVLWLRLLSVRDPLANRAYKLVLDILEKRQGQGSRTRRGRRSIRIRAVQVEKAVAEFGVRRRGQRRRIVASQDSWWGR